MHYRLYALHESSGKIVSAQDIMAEDDGEAIAAGREALAERPFEIWCRTHRVFSCEPGAAPGATVIIET